MNAHKVCNQWPDAAAASLRAGMDLECNGGGKIMKKYLVKALEQGKITEEEIDYALTNVLRARIKLGIFDPIDSNPYNRIKPSVVGCNKHTELALETARQSMVLLQKQRTVFCPLTSKRPIQLRLLDTMLYQTIFGDYSGVPLNDPVSPYTGIKQIVKNTSIINYVDSKLTFPDLNMVGERFLTTPDGKKGLKATYFNNQTLEGEGQDENRFKN